MKLCFGFLRKYFHFRKNALRYYHKCN
jgi:hypothetical protein